MMVTKIGPWQFDRRVVHDGYKNWYSFKKDGRKITVIEDQVKLRRSIEKENTSETESKSVEKGEAENSNEEKRVIESKNK